MPNKAKLVTREATTSTVTSDNLNKGSALEFTELDSNLINLRDQTFGVVGDDSSTIEVGAGDTLYIRGGTNVTTSTNSDGSITINSTASGGSDLGNLQVNDRTLSPVSTNADLLLDAHGTGKVKLSGLAFPNNDGANGQILQTNGSGVLSFVDQASGLSNVVQDTSPQLGGNLDLNGKQINGGVSGIEIESQGSTQGGYLIQYNGTQFNFNTDGNDTQLFQFFGNVPSTNPTLFIVDAYKDTDNDGKGAVSIKNPGLISGSGNSAASTLTVQGSKAFNVHGESLMDRMILAQNTITTDSSNLDLELSANGTGTVTINGLAMPTSDGTNGQVLTTNGSGTLSFADASGISASSTDTLTNKTIDADNNTVSNIEVDNLKSGVLDTDISSVAATDTTLASAKAIKTYVDAQIATKDNTDEITEGSTNLYFTNARADARISNAIVDEDNMASNSATQVPSQQSVKAYVDAEVAGVVDSAPGTLDTLNELAAALGDDANFATTTSTALGNRLRIDTNAQGLTSTQKTNATTNLGLNAVATSGAYSDLSGTPTIPSNNNQLTNGAGYLTSETFTSLAQDTTPQLGGNLDLNGNDIVTTSNADIELAANGTGKVVVKGNTNPGTIVLNCESNTHGQTIKAQPHSAAVTNTLTLPSGGDQEIVGTAATQTLTNKTLTSPVLNTGVSGTAILDEDNMASNSATQLATQQSIKAYVDAEVAGAGGGGVTIQDEGSALSTTATTLNFVGSGVAATGTGATKTITISGGGGSASTGDFTFTGNNMSTTSSNADMELSTSGTGMIVLKGNGGPTPVGSANRYTNGNVLSYYDHNVTPGSTRFYKNSAVMDLKMDGSNSSSSNDRFRAFNSFLKFDINGSELTNSGGSRGPMGMAGGVDVLNSSSSTATIGNIVGSNCYNYVYNGASSGNGNVNITNAQAFRAYSPAEYDGISGTVTNAFGFYVGSPIAYSYNNSNLTVTNSYGYYYRHNPDNATFTNDPYAFYTNDDSVRSNPGALNKFNEYSYNATHSANGAYTIDWANGNLQTVTLGANITGFTMSNFPTSTKQSVGVTLYLVQDGTGSRTMTFSATGGETFKFANGVTTSSVSSANDIQTVYIFSKYNGSSNTFYWTLGPTYS